MSLFPTKVEVSTVTAVALLSGGSVFGACSDQAIGGLLTLVYSQMGSTVEFEIRMSGRMDLGKAPRTPMTHSVMFHTAWDHLNCPIGSY